MPRNIQDKYESVMSIISNLIASSLLCEREERYRFHSFMFTSLPDRYAEKIPLRIWVL
jgi:hypothetical protein